MIYNKAITTHSGKRFDFLDPQPDMVDIDDIAYSLARLPRWNGHSNWPVSVAQHSLMVEHMVNTWGASTVTCMYALLHDAAEAYMGDVSTPLKRLLPDFKRIEAKVEQLIWDALELPPLLDPLSIYRADVESCKWEARDVMPASCPIEAPSDPQRHRVPALPFWEVKRDFLDRYYRLRESLSREAAA